MSNGKEVADDLKEAKNNLYRGIAFFDGGNVGRALAGKYIGNSNEQLATSIDRLTERLDTVIDLVNTSLKAKSSVSNPQSQSSTKSEGE